MTSHVEGDGFAVYTVFREPCLQMLVQVIGREMGEEGRVTVFVFLYVGWSQTQGVALSQTGQTAEHEGIFQLRCMAS